MGNKFLDQYTYLHFATGIVAYFFGISIKNWIIIHILFEIIENTKFGMKMINMFKLIIYKLIIGEIMNFHNKYNLFFINF